MTFRSPPPHRHMSRQTKGRSRFEQDQLDLQRLVKQCGWEKLPINDEALRPFMSFLWGFATAKGYKIVTFDRPSKEPDRLYHGLVGSAVLLKQVTDDLAEALRKVPTLAPDLGKANLRFKLGRISVCYFEGIWTPKAALAGRRH